MKRIYEKPSIIRGTVILEEGFAVASITIGGGLSSVEIEEETFQEDTQDWMFKID